MNHEEKAGREALVNLINDGASYAKILGALVQLAITYGDADVRKIFLTVNVTVRGICKGN